MWRFSRRLAVNMAAFVGQPFGQILYSKCIAQILELSMGIDMLGARLAQQQQHTHTHTHKFNPVLFIAVEHVIANSSLHRQTKLSPCRPAAKLLYIYTSMIFYQESCLIAVSDLCV